MKRIFSRCLAASALGLLTLSSAAFAQYVWLDERGVKQYSDMPPPPSVPANRILKQRGPYAPSTSSTAADASTNAGSAPAKTEITTAEKNAEFRKRRTEQAEKDKKAEAEAKTTADKAKNCERAREYQRVLDSGERIARRDKNGEQYFLSDEQRSSEAREAKRALEDCR